MENLEKLFGSLTPSELDELAPADFDARAPRGAVKRIENMALDKAGLKAKKRARLKPLIIAAAATTVLLLAGFTTAVVKGKHVFSFDNEHSMEQGFDLTLEPRELTIPEEFKPQDGETSFSDNVDMTPRELLEKFGITPPFNDNFTDIADYKPNVSLNSYDDGDTNVSFHYNLYNKSVDSNITFEVMYFSYADRLDFHSHTGLFPGEPTEVITLNNGARCMVSAWTAAFSYDGAFWELRLDWDYPIPENYGELSKREQKKIIAEMIEAMPGIETVKQVLADMELL